MAAYYILTQTITDIDRRKALWSYDFRRNRPYGILWMTPSTSQLRKSAWR